MYIKYSIVSKEKLISIKGGFGLNLSSYKYVLANIYSDTPCRYWGTNRIENKTTHPTGLLEPIMELVDEIEVSPHLHEMLNSPDIETAMIAYNWIIDNYEKEIYINK